jgi:hypothetical protein
MAGLSVPGRYQPRSVKTGARVRFLRERKQRLIARIPGGLRAISDAQAGIIQQLLAAEWELSILEIEMERHRRIVLRQNELVFKLNREFDRLTTPRPEPASPPETIDELRRRVLAERDAPLRRGAR